LPLLAGDRSANALSRPRTTLAERPVARSAAGIGNSLDISTSLPLCRCRRAVVDDETCILCGRYVAVPDRSDEPAPEAPREQWSRAGIVRAIRAFVFFHDRPPSEAEWLGQSGSSWPNAHAVSRLFGSFDDGLAAAGVI
jgi:hypothetical protein